MNLTLLKAALPYLLWVAIGIGWTAVSYYTGHAAGSAKEQASWNADRTTQARAQTTAITITRNAEAVLSDTLGQQETSNQQKVTDATAQKNHLVDSLRVGAVRVSIPTRTTACSPTVNTSPPAAAEPTETRTELAPAAGEDLAAIASDGDLAILDLNECIDRYNTVRAATAALNASLSHAQAQ